MLYFKFAKMHLKKMTQYRLSFFLSLLSQAIVSLAALASMYFLFDRFNVVEGWSFSQVAVSYAVVYFCFSFAECFFRGFDVFARLIKSGGLDAFFVRPRSIFYQTLCSNVEFSKIGRLVVSLAVLVYSCAIQPFAWGVDKIAVLIGMLVCGIVIFLALFMLGASFSIFTVEGIEVVNIFTDGGRDLCQYPLNIYPQALTKIFTYIIPFACFNYLPMMYLFDMPGVTIWGNALAPLYGMVIIIPAYLIFKWSLKKYNSTGT
ncbi:MAG: ABC-2 family transporter protein [Clostridia bacterium]|nr:ABC-2 family transporter protein [Clostridia bacterium]